MNEDKTWAEDKTLEEDVLWLVYPMKRNNEANGIIFWAIFFKYAFVQHKKSVKGFVCVDLLVPFYTNGS